MQYLSKIVRCYYYLNWLLGLTSVRFNFHSQSLDFHHRPTILYSLLLNLSCLLLIPYLYAQQLDCAFATIYSALHLLVAGMQVTSFFISFFIIWRKRRQLRKLAHTFRYIYRKYRDMLDVEHNLWRKLRNEIIKYVGFALPKILAMYIDSFYNNQCQPKHRLLQLLSGLCLCTFGVMQLLMDLNFYFLFLFGEIFYAMLLAHMHSTSTDVLALAQYHANAGPHYRGTMWRRHLAAQVCDFANDKVQVDIYVQLFVDVFASRLMLTIACYYLIMTASLFYIYAKSAQSEQIYAMVLLQVLLDSGSSFFCSLFFFGICERITEIALEVHSLLTQIMVNAPERKEKENDGQLQRRVEFLLFRLKTDSQNPLTIFGFMDLNYRTYFEIQVSLFSSVLILYQSFFFNI